MTIRTRSKRQLIARVDNKEIHCSAVNMKELSLQVFGELKYLAMRDNILLEIDAIPNAQGDFNLIKQVVRNLLSYAIKFSSKKTFSKIVIHSQTTDYENIYSISDNGVGFNIEYASALFKVFQRLHSETEFEGTGVGLAIAARIIQRHNGRVWAISEIKKGATFYFSLPR